MPYMNDLRKSSLTERWTRNNKPQRFLISSQDIVIQVSKKYTQLFLHRKDLKVRRDKNITLPIKVIKYSCRPKFEIQLNTARKRHVNKTDTCWFFVWLYLYSILLYGQVCLCRVCVLCKRVCLIYILFIVVKL